jgi:hypothetical protein
MISPKYKIGYEYKAGKANAFIEKIQDGMYFLRYSDFIGYVCCRTDVFDANHRVEPAVSMGTGLPPHPELMLVKKMPFS